MPEMDVDKVLEVMTDGILVVDEEGRIAYANPAAGLLAGKGSEEMVGSLASEVFSCDPTTTMEERPLGEEGRCLARITLPNGRERMVRMNSYPVEGGFQLVLTEKGVLSEIEKRLLEDWIGLRDFLDDLRSIIATLDLEGNITFMNKGGLDFLGYYKEDVIGRPGADLLANAEDAVVYREMVEEVKKGLTSQIEVRLRAKDGTVRHVSMHNSLVTLPGREGSLVLAIGQDRTDERVYEEVIAKRNELLEILLDWGMEVIRSPEPREAFLDGFDRIAVFLDYERAMVVMEDAALEVITDRGELGGDVRLEPLRGFIPYALSCEELTYLGDLGERFPGLPRSAIVLPLRGPHEERAAAILLSSRLITHDQDERNVMDILAYNLEHQFRFMVLKERLNDSLERISLYNDVILHDMRNLVSPVSSYLELMDMNRSSPERMEGYLTKAMEHQGRLNRFLETIGVLLRTREGATLSPVPVIDAVERAIASTLGKERGAKVVFAAEDREALTDALVNADELLPNVFMNILLNAVAAGGGEVTVLGESEPEYGICRVAVEDRGEGVDDATKEVIFQRTRRRGSTGFGIGLVIVRELVHRYNGRVWVEDRVPGDHTRGARFVVELPMA